MVIFLWVRADQVKAYVHSVQLISLREQSMKDIKDKLDNQEKKKSTLERFS